MEGLWMVLECVVLHINVVLDACAQLPRVSFQAAKLHPNAPSGPYLSLQASAPRAYQPTIASPSCPAEEWVPVRRTPSPLEAARVRAPSKRPIPRESSATDPSPFEANRPKQARGSKVAREAARETRGDWEQPQAPRNIRRHIMLQSGDFPPDWEMFARHFATPPVDPSRPRFPQKW